MKLLLDTCTFLWLASNSPKVSKSAASAFLDSENERYLSAASALEIAVKYALGRMALPQRPDLYIYHVREKSGIETLAIDEDAAIYSARLPRVHSDPFDRILVAQAIMHGMTILTPDEEIAQYGVRVLW